MAEQGVAATPVMVECDVLVVGYGPCGMTCAALLAHHGLDVVVIERHPERYKLHRAGHLDGETMRTFQGLGVADEIELIAQPVVASEIRSAEGEVLMVRESGQSGSGWKRDYLAHQTQYEAVIDARGRQLGVRVFMGLTAEGLDQDADGVSTFVRPSGTQEAQLRIVSRYVIGADGANSFVRAAIGSHREDLGFRSIPHLVVDLEFVDPDIDLPQLPEAANVLIPGRPQLAGRWGGRRWTRFEFSLTEGESDEVLESEDYGWQLLSAWQLTPDMATIVRQAIYVFDSTMADPWRSRRVFLMGDAAHTAPPYLGQGLLSGIRDAANLSWKMAAVLTGHAHDRFLDSYELERRSHVAALIEMACNQGRLILATDPEQIRVRDEVLRSGKGPRPAFPRLTSGVVRPPGATDGYDGPGGDGRPSLQARVALGSQVGRLDDLLRPGWRIVSRHPVPLDLFNESQRVLLTSLDMQWAHVSRGAHFDTSYYDIDAEFDQWYLASGRKAFVERPDHYVFGTAQTNDDLPALLDELAASLNEHGWDSVGAMSDAS